MTWVPPVNRWSSRYSISHPEHVLHVIAVFKSLDNSQDLTVEIGEDAPDTLTQSTTNVQGIFSLHCYNTV